jgi:long-chain acyl-CoA synthetase
VEELVWHRQYLPTVERNAGTTYVVEAATGRSSTYGESGARVLRLAHALRTQLGVSPGDRVAVMSLNSGAFLELYHAGLLGAAVVNPLNLRFAPRELTHVLADSGTEVVFVDAVFAGVIAGVREAAGVRTVVLLGDAPDGTPHDLRYEDLLAAGRRSSRRSRRRTTRRC